MTVETNGRSRTSRRKTVLRLAAAGLAAVGLGLFAPSGNANAAGRCVENSLYAPVVGSWYAQVYFPGQPFPGRTESTMLTFTPGGGVIEANPVNTSPAANSGFWKLNSDCSYFMHQVHFTWNTTTTGVEQAFTVDVTFRMSDANHFQSQSARATVHQFDPQSGQRVFGPFVVENVSQFFGERFSTWQVPDHFPAEPILP